MALGAVTPRAARDGSTDIRPNEADPPKFLELNNGDLENSGDYYAGQEDDDSRPLSLSTSGAVIWMADEIMAMSGFSAHAAG